jgi:hypothetical protein
LKLLPPTVSLIILSIDTSAALVIDNMLTSSREEKEKEE